MGARAQRKKCRFVGIPHHICISEQWDDLTGNETKLLLQLYRQYTGSNNGDFSCTWNMMKKKGWGSPVTLNKAKKGLMRKGWLEETRKGYTGRCSLYAVTFQPIDDCQGKLDVNSTKIPSMAFIKIKDPNT